MKTKDKKLSKKRLRRWWRDARKRFAMAGMKPYDVYMSGWRIMWKVRGAGDMMTWGACMMEDDIVLYGDWTALVDKFYPSRSPFRFASVEEMIGEMKTISRLMLMSDLSLDKYIREHNSAWVGDHEGRVDLMLYNDLKNQRYNGLTAEEWEENHEKRKQIIRDAINDANICAVVQVPAGVGFFGNIPNVLWIVIEDDADLISQREWDAAWEKWSNIYNDTFRIQLRIASRTEMMNYIYTNRPWGLGFLRGAIWWKGQRPSRHRR